MKASDIRVGGTYTDLKQGVRQVLEVGQHLRTLGMHADAVGVRYLVLMAAQEPNVATESTMELKSFAVWSKSEVPEAEVESTVIALKAEKVTASLTEPQHAFLMTFTDDLSEGDSIECPRREFRMAVACRQKGLIAEMPERLRIDEASFELRFNALGLAVLKQVLSGHQA